MDNQIRFTHVDECQVDESEFMRARRLFGPEQGSDLASLVLATVQNGYDTDVGPLDFDEILYLTRGIAEVEVGGVWRSLGPGNAMFIPQGATYRWKVVEGPNEFVVVIAPPEGYDRAIEAVDDGR